VVAFSRGTPADNLEKSQQYGLDAVLLQAVREVGIAYQATATPSAVVVRRDGTIGSYVAQGAAQIATLVQQVRSGTVLTAAALSGSDEAPCPTCGQVHGAHSNGGSNGNGAGAPNRLPTGVQAPPVRLPDLDGEEAELASFKGHPALMLFWNPACGFCQRLLTDMTAWERRRSKDDPALLIVSTGSVEANRALGFQSRIVLDAAFATGTKFGVQGTPSAVLIDADGRVASDVAVGANAILELVGATPVA
jgi:peroxiredoxin